MTQKIAVVTGANRGIGLEVCRQLVKKEVTVILTARDPVKGETAAKQLRVKGYDVHFHPLDVTDPDSPQNLVGHVKAKFGRLDILINNAGIFIDRDRSGLTVPLNTVKKTMETNVYGPLLLCQAVIPLMKQHNFGRIVNVSSGMGQLTGMGGNALAYRVSKTALNAATAILANEVQPSNILINAVGPGWVRTDMGGPGAGKSVEDGADTVVWLAMLPDDGPNGGFFEDRQSIPW
jgi:NAD(P)-dependent dehydrogenase (short-subunit alcohol dehydrogenase family)